MADVFNFYVRDNRKINFEIAEPIMREDSGVTDFIFHIPKILNGLEVSDWQWWFVFVNAKKEKYSIALTLSDDPESPLEFNIATYTVDYAMSIKAGSVQFALEAINAGTGGAIDNEWHTLTYETKVKETLQGNQAEYAETESDVISALLIEVRNKVTQLVGGATPLPVNLKSLMTDPQKVYLYTGSEQGEYTENWYYHNGTQFVSGGVYGAGVTDAVPTQGSTNAVSSGGVYDALHDTDTTLSQNGQAADAAAVGGVKNSVNYLLDYTVIDEESMSGTFHDDENIYGVKVSGSANAFTNILLANKKNLIPDLNIVTETKNGITFSGGGRFWNVSGTSTASTSKSTTPDFVSTDIPAGTYIVRVYRSGSYTASDNPYFSIVGKKADNSTVTIGSFYLNTNPYREWSKTISSDIVSVRVVFAVANGTAITDTLKLWICMFPSDVTIMDTEETVESGSTKTLDVSRATYSDGVDTMQHASVALYNPKIQGYVEDYVSNNIPEGVLTESIIPFITPEMYGAKGDGNTDDTAALQACINAASSSLSNNIPLRGYGKYKVSSPLRIGGYYLDIFIKTITYTGSNAALIISGKNSKFEFDEVIASESGACGIRVQSAPDENVKYTGFDSNVLKVYQRIYANGNALEMIRSSDATEGLMYNDFNIHKLHSSNANCIYATATGNFEENDIRGQYFSAPNGYAYYGATPYTHTTRLFDFCIEQTVKNGIFGGANLYRVRTTECMNYYTEEEPDRGRIFVFDGFFPRSYADRDTRVSLLSLDADNAKSWDDIINDARDYYDNHDVLPITAFNKVWTSNNFYSTFEFCDIVAESGFAGSTAILPRGKAFVYYNHVAFKPNVEWYESISDATYIISLERTQASAQKYITPTFFDINVAISSIYLDWSYCCLAINKFTVRQYADKKAKVYDKFGILIFDGTNQAEGDYVFNCVKKNIDENVTMRDGTVLDWSAIPYNARDIYSGANELWKIEKFNTIA